MISLFAIACRYSKIPRACALRSSRRMPGSSSLSHLPVVTSTKWFHLRRWGVWQRIHHRQGGLKDAESFARMVSATGDFSATAVSSGRSLPFSIQALTAVKACSLDCIDSQLVMLWVFLGQVLSADHSCRAAIARLIAHRLSHGQQPCSALRKRAPAAKPGNACPKSSSRTWIGRPVVGPMADTAEN
jgi:hypothetical protein